MSISPQRYHLCIGARVLAEEIGSRYDGKLLLNRIERKTEIRETFEVIQSSKPSDLSGLADCPLVH